MRRGMYEIIFAFFLIVVLVAAVLFFIYLNTSSSAVYAKLRKQTSGPQEASALKDALLTCHKLDYLDASILDDRSSACPAKDMLQGFTVTQYAMNGCPPTVWNYAKPGKVTQVIPFVVSVEQQNGKRCLAKLDVFIGGTA